MTWEIILEILFLLAIVTFVFLKHKTMRIPAMKLLGEALPGTVPKAKDGKEKELQALEFRYVGDYDVAMMKGATATMRVYLAPDGLACAGIYEIVMGEMKAGALDISSELDPSGSITTTLASNQSIYARPPDKLMAKVPWMTTSGEVYELHRVLCEQAQKEGYQIKDLSRITLVDNIRKSLRDEMEYQVERGRYKRVAEDEYRMTILGAAIAVPLIWYRMCFGALLGWYRPGKTIFCWKLRRGLRRATELRKKAVEADVDVETTEQEGGLYMPNITFDGPRIEDVERKRELIRSVSEAAAKAYGLPKQAMIVVIKENAPENVGVGGELLADRVKTAEPPKVGAGSRE